MKTNQKGFGYTLIKYFNKATTNQFFVYGFGVVMIVAVFMSVYQYANR